MLRLNRIVPAVALLAFGALLAPAAAHADLALSLFNHGSTVPTNTFTVNVGQLLQIDAQVVNMDTTQGAITGTGNDSITPTPAGTYDDTGALLNFSSITLNTGGTSGDTLLANAINFTPVAADAGQSFTGTFSVTGNTTAAGGLIPDVSQNFTINVTGAPPVPEASSFVGLLGMTSLGGILALRRRRK
jgi:MYXO-CTERM domain-containing protein